MLGVSRQESTAPLKKKGFSEVRGNAAAPKQHLLEMHAQIGEALKLHFGPVEELSPALLQGLFCFNLGRPAEVVLIAHVSKALQKHQDCLQAVLGYDGQGR